MLSILVYVQCKNQLNRLKSKSLNLVYIYRLLQMFKQVILFVAHELFKYTTTSTLLISTDAAETFTKVDLHFKYKAETLQFNPFSDERLLLFTF